MIVVKVSIARDTLTPSMRRYARKLKGARKAELLKENGFTDLVVGMLRGGIAFYPSGVLPVYEDVATLGDPLAECIDAGQKYGIRIHAWKAAWNLENKVPKSFIQQMRSERRLQQKYDGSEGAWLCPSHPKNQQLEQDAFLDLVRNYPVDGIHFDFIRYPGPDFCFCGPCRERFEKSSEKAVADWPNDVRPDGKRRDEWGSFAQNNITQVVQGTSEGARKIRPGIQVSAAVFRNWEKDSRMVMQHWRLWCERGYLDFVCPMDYTDSPSTHRRWVTEQKQCSGPAKLVAGIGPPPPAVRSTWRT